MSNDPVHDAVLAAVHLVFNISGEPKLMALVDSGDFAIADLGGDSMDITDFCFQVESALDVEIAMSDTVDFPTFSQFVAMLKTRLSEAA